MLAGFDEQEVERAGDLGGSADRPVGEQPGQAPVLGMEREDERLPQRRGGGGRRRRGPAGPARRSRTAASRRAPPCPRAAPGWSTRRAARWAAPRRRRRRAATRRARRSPRCPAPMPLAAANALRPRAVAAGDQRGGAAAGFAQAGQELRPGDVGSANDAPSGSGPATASRGWLLALAIESIVDCRLQYRKPRRASWSFAEMIRDRNDSPTRPAWLRRVGGAWPRPGPAGGRDGDIRRLRRRHPGPFAIAESRDRPISLTNPYRS